MKTVFILLLMMCVVGCGNYHTPMTAQISTLAPATGTAGGPQFMLTVNGSGFASNSVVYFSTVAETTTFTSAKQLVATIPASEIAAVGMKPVYVFIPAGGAYGSSQTSNTVNFPVN